MASDEEVVRDALAACFCGSWLLDGFYRRGCPAHDPETGLGLELPTDDDGVLD